MTLWRIYFWFYLIYSVLAVLGALGQLGREPLISLLAILTQVILVAGLYSYITNKKLTTSQNWRKIFYLAIIIWLAPLVFQFSVVLSGPILPFTLIAALLDIPSFVAIYRLSKS